MSLRESRFRLVSALACALLASPAHGKPLVSWGDLATEERRAQEELEEIQGRIDRGDLPKVQFDFDSARLRPEAEPVLDLIADVLRRNPRLKLRITAHTCTIGTREYNLHLSRARAKSVKEGLTRRGIPPPSIRFYGKGPDEPVADNRTEEGRELNRRVEFHIVKRDWSSIY
ncbi:MAG: OmpA family protein [Elusimicrobia bacterium]|nr:OmpA family protein [Elusimicrobiota bacterium]